jgi:hypothetical protein
MEEEMLMTRETDPRSRIHAGVSKTRGVMVTALWLTSSVFGASLAPHLADAQAENPEEIKRSIDKLFDAGDFKINEENPEANIPTDAQRNAAPVQFGYFLMNLTEKGAAATERGDHATAIKYYRALTATVPESVGGPRRLCAAYEANGERAKAEDTCGGVLLREGVTVGDYIHYADLVLAQPEPLTEKQIARVDTVISHVRKGAPEVGAASEVQCKLGLRLNDEKRMAECTEQLNRIAPEDPKTISYAWLYAIMRLDQKGAWEAVERAKQAKLEASAIEMMETSTRNLRSPWVRAFFQHRRTVVSAATSALLALIAVLIFRRRAQRGQQPIPTENRVS